jgi:hypothetical protein
MDREMTKLKEIVAQEYEFKMQHLESLYQSKTKELLSEFEAQREQLLASKESEILSAVLNEKCKLQRERAKSHAQATQEIYDEIS